MILIPIGTKAQLIKMAPVILALKRHKLPFDFVLTGQHHETMMDLIGGFGLPAPAYSLTTISEADTSVKLATWLFNALRVHLKSSSEIASRHYHFCLVHGDTMSTLVGAMIARRHGIKIAHVEAGLRSHSLFHPFPEEITRLLVSRLSNIFYCNGGTSATNIQRISKNAEIVDVGQNTLLDSVRFALQDEFRPDHANDAPPYCVISIHRFENLTNTKRFNFIMDTVQKFSRSIAVKFVLHAATRNKLSRSGWLAKLEDCRNIELLPRMRYFEFINLISRAQFLVSDGGSNQEECSYLGIPCILMRQKTERDEGIGKNVVLSEYNPAKIQRFFDTYCDAPARPASLIAGIQSQPSETIAIDLKARLN